MMDKNYLVDTVEKVEPIILFVFDENFNQKGIIHSTLSLTWEEEYAGRGKFALICTDTAENVELIQENWYYYRKDSDTAMVIRQKKIDGEKNQIVGQGFSTLDLLRQRIIYKTRTIKNIEQGIYSIVNTQKRGMPYLETAPLKNITKSTEQQFTGKNVLETVTALASENELGVVMNFDYRNKKHLFEVYEGADRSINQSTNATVVFSDEHRTLHNISYETDLSIFANVAYVAGEGEGAQRKWISVGTATGYKRYELFVDARDIQTETTNDAGDKITLTEAEVIKRMQERGRAKLNEHIKAEVLKGVVSPLYFRQDYNLGDIVTGESKKYGLRFHVRITAYEEVQENNRRTLKITLGNPEITVIDILQSRFQVERR